MPGKRLIAEESDREKFDYIFQCYGHRMLFRAKQILCSQHDAEDAVQEAFIYIARNINLIDEVESVRTINLLMLITKYKSVDIWRKNNRKLRKEYVPEPETLRSRRRLEEEVIYKETLKEVIAIIFQLPDHYREVLELNIVYELRPIEIAELLHLSRSLANKRMQRGRKLLKKRLEEAKLI